MIIHLLYLYRSMTDPAVVVVPMLSGLDDVMYRKCHEPEESITVTQAEFLQEYHLDRAALSKYSHSNLTLNEAKHISSNPDNIVVLREDDPYGYAVLHD